MLSRLLKRSATAHLSARVTKTAEERQRDTKTGNWACWTAEDQEQLFTAAAHWRDQLPPGSKYWLCWNVNDAWSRVQQRLILETGWVPVVGSDDTVANPTVLDGAIGVNFGAPLGIAGMWMEFPLELIFAWVDRLAFWHSDVLLPRKLMKDFARQFEALRGPVTAAVFARRNLWKPRAWNNASRWFEVLGGSTREASAAQYRVGCGWWRNFQSHPHCPDTPAVWQYGGDHGGGIRCWERLHDGDVQRVHFPARYHFNHVKQVEVHRTGTATKGQALDQIDLPRLAEGMGIWDLVDV